MMADLLSLSEGAHTFFLWKFLILSHFLNLKTPTEDSRLRHERAFFITLGTIEKLACLLPVFIFFNFLIAPFFIKLSLSVKTFSKKEKLIEWEFDQIVSLEFETPINSNGSTLKRFDLED